MFKNKLSILTFVAALIFAVSCGKKVPLQGDDTSNVDAKPSSSPSDTIENNSGEPDADEHIISVGMASGELLSNPQNYVLFENDSEIGMPYVYKVSEDVTNFALLTIIFFEAADNGKIVFNRGNELYSIEKLTPDKPLVVKMYIPGPIPSFAVSFTDSKGIERLYAVGESGEDGEPYLQPMGAGTNYIIQ